MVNEIPAKSAWAHDGFFRSVEEHRKIFRPATSRVITDVLNHYLSPYGNLIEIGSGTGELTHNLLPSDSPFKQSIIETEQSLPFLQEHRRQNPTHRLIAANAYHLPFPNKSVDGILGYWVFDTLVNLPNAIEEMARVLKSGGKVIHFLEGGASEIPYFSNISLQDPPPLLVPITDDIEGDGVAIFPRNEIVNNTNPYLKGQLQNNRILQRLLALSPVELCDQYDQLVMPGIAALLEKYVPAERIFFTPYFLNQLHTTLKTEGFRIEEFGLKTGKAVAPYKQGAWYMGNVATCELRRKPKDAEVYDPNIPEGQIKTVSRIHVAVATKQ